MKVRTGHLAHTACSGVAACPAPPCCAACRGRRTAVVLNLQDGRAQAAKPSAAPRRPLAPCVHACLVPRCPRPGGEVDVRGCYCALAACEMLRLDKRAVADACDMAGYIRRCQVPGEQRRSVVARGHADARPPLCSVLLPAACSTPCPYSLARLPPGPHCLHARLHRWPCRAVHSDFPALWVPANRLQSYEGGIGGEPWNEAHGGYTFCGLAASALLGQVGRAPCQR